MLGRELTGLAPLPSALFSVHWSRGGRSVQQAMLAWVVVVATSQLSRVSLMVLQVSSRDWGPVLGTDIERIESGNI